MDYLAIITKFIAFLDKHTWIPTFLTIISAIYIAFLQINRQLENTIKAQRTNKLDELHMQIYKEIADKIETCEVTLTNSYEIFRRIPISFENKISEDNYARTIGLPESSFKISERFSTLNAQQFEVTSKFTQMLSVMEKYEIAFDNFTTMYQHLSQRHQKLIEAISDVIHFTMQFLPVDVKEEDQAIFNGAKVIIKPLPDLKTIAHIRALSESASEQSLTMTAFLHDLRIESQNALLSPIFNGKTAPKRIPGDPSRYPVLSRDDNGK